MQALVIDMRAMRLRELSRRISEGTYDVDPDAVAEAIVEVIQRARSRAADRAHRAS
jgi:anti-sigma28 factor (negative regulator of flagellin synthesis)